MQILEKIVVCVRFKRRAKISVKKKLATIAERDEAAWRVVTIRGYFKVRSKQDKAWNHETSRLNAIINNQEYGRKQTVPMNTFTVDAFTTERKQPSHEVIKRFRAQHNFV